MSAEDYKTPHHQIAFAILPKVGGALSLAGSTLILRDVGQKWKDKPLTTEVVAHITVANLFIAFWECFLSTWMVPGDSPAFMASGNTITCEVQGFISVAAFVVLEFSYTILAVLYWIMVARGWNERMTQRWKIRFFFLGVPILVAFLFCIPALIFDMFNFTGAYSCFIEEYPLNCDIDHAVGGCTRGAHARDWQAALFLGIGVCTVVILVFMVLLVRAVRLQEKATDRYAMQGQTKRREMTNKAFWQAVRYISVFLVSNFPFYVFGIYDIVHRYPPLGVTYVYVIVWPLFGVFNSFVYFRPRFLSYRAKNPDKSYMHCLMTILNIQLGGLGSLFGRTDESIPPSVSDLIEDDDLGSPLFQDDIGYDGEAGLPGL